MNNSILDTKFGSKVGPCGAIWWLEKLILKELKHMPFQLVKTCVTPVPWILFKKFPFAENIIRGFKTLYAYIGMIDYQIVGNLYVLYVLLCTCVRTRQQSQQGNL